MTPTGAPTVMPPAAPTTTAVCPLTWVLPVPMAARAAGELVHAVAHSLPSSSRSAVARLTALLVNRVREVVPVAVWLRVELTEDRLRVEVADAAVVRVGPTYARTMRRLPPQNSIGLPPPIEQYTVASGVRQLDESHRAWWFEIDVPQGG